MSQLLALEWNGPEARVAVASRHGHRTVIEQAFVVPLRAEVPDSGAAAPDVGEQIAEALRAQGLGSLDALVAVGRGSVELRLLQLPAATDEELPQLVRFQALTEFNELDEKWALDFIPFDESVRGGPRTVLAAAVAPELCDRIDGVCRQSGLKMQRLVLRSCAAASLLPRSKTVERGSAQLLVELFSDQADLTVACGGQAQFLRTMRLGDASAQFQNLSSGIRLTLAAAQNQCSGHKIVGIVLFGRGQSDLDLAKQIEKETKIRTTLVDPFAGFELRPQLSMSPPEHPGRFAAVLGMLTTELDRMPHAIDFLHPRRPKESVAPRSKWKIAAVAAALLVAGWLIYGRMARAELESEIEELTAKIDEADALLNRKGEKNIAAAAEIAKWDDGEVIWLDHLRELSKDFPPAADVTLSQLTLVVPPASSEGKMQLKGWAKNAETIAAMEQKLRKQGRRVVGDKSQEDRSKAPYSWQFNTSVFVGKEVKR
jgi:Tfp pilus assembly PilM family ATPase